MSLFSLRWAKYGLIVVTFAWIVFNLATLTAYPLPTCDEAFYTRTAQNYISQQQWPPTSASFFFLPYGRLYWALLGYVQQITNSPLLFGRILSFCGLLLTSAATYWLAQALGARRLVALWAALLVAFSWLGFFVSHRIRPNIFAVAMAVIVLALLETTLRTNRWRVTALFGFLLAAPLVFHSTGVYLSFAAGLWFCATMIKRRQWGCLLLGVFTAGVGLLCILWVRLGAALPLVAAAAVNDPSAFIAGYVSASGAQASLFDALVWFAEFWWGYYGWFAPPLSLMQAMLFLLALGYMLYAGAAPMKRLVLLLLLSSVPFAIVNADFTSPPEYAFLWLPLYAIVTVYAADHLADRLKANWRILPYGVLGLLLTAYAAGDLYLIVRERNSVYQVRTAAVLAVVEPDASLMAASYWWYGLQTEQRFIDETQLAPVGSILWWNAVPNAAAAGPLSPNVDITEMSDVELATTAAETLNDLNPDYILEDGRIGCATDPSPIAETVTTYAETQCQPLAEFDQLVSNNIERYYGEQVLYDCRAPEQPME